MSSDPQLLTPARPAADVPSEEAAIVLQDVGKVFEIYDRPVHRLLQMLFRGRRTFYRSFEACTISTLPSAGANVSAS